MRSLRLLAVALLLCTLSCGRKSPEEKLVKSIDAAAGWVPALQMTTEKWIANSVPTRFVDSAAQAAQKEFEKAQKTIETSKASPALRHRIAADLRDANAFAAKLGNAAGRDQPRDMIPALRALPQINADLDAIQKQYGGGT